MRQIRFLAVALFAIAAAPTTVAADDKNAAAERFIAEFDVNIEQMPIAADLVAHDPVFRARVLGATVQAYTNGGWPAADDALAALLYEKQSEITWTLLHADDKLVVALWQRYLAATLKLKDAPAACRSYTDGNGARISSFPSARGEIVAVVAAKNAAYASGAANFRRNSAPELPSPDRFNSLLDQSTAIGKPYNEQERTALTVIRRGKPESVSDATFCAAQIKLRENFLALPEADAAAAIRYHWGHWIAEQPGFH